MVTMILPLPRVTAVVDWMSRDDIQWAFEAIVGLDLTFDALGFPPHLENSLPLLKR